MEDDEDIDEDSDDADDLLADDNDDESDEDEEEISLEKLMAQKRKATSDVPAGAKNLQPEQKRPNNGVSPQQQGKPQQQQQGKPQQQ